MINPVTEQPTFTNECISWLLFKLSRLPSLPVTTEALAIPDKPLFLLHAEPPYSSDSGIILGTSISCTRFQSGRRTTHALLGRWRHSPSSEYTYARHPSGGTYPNIPMSSRKYLILLSRKPFARRLRTKKKTYFGARRGSPTEYQTMQVGAEA